MGPDIWVNHFVYLKAIYVYFAKSEDPFTYPWNRSSHHAPLSVSCLILLIGHPCLRIKIISRDILGLIRHFGWFSRWPP